MPLFYNSGKAMINFFLSKLIYYTVVLICGVVLLINVPFAIESTSKNQKFTTLDLKIEEKKKTSETIHISNFPVKGGHLSSRFGMRKDPIHGSRRMHKGIDIAAKTGSSVYPLGKGTVLFAGRKAGYGNLIEIKHGNTIISRYAHLHKILVKKGETVLASDKIGLVGRTGRSTGPHLHLEVALNNKLVDPQIFLLKEYASQSF